ncbi:hypothetical protein [Aurantibacillus circumpalustris]|uniref:hypothetical protein n=1 Tax=Aurantibacillus circumpalustris TaxID=3036359 RepID=UPI00295A6326|nr:hypothetical protein [Aurantibacillus circumpalustris]
MKSTLSTYSLYDLSNPHFSRVTLFTSDNKKLRGQFVQFKVVKDSNFEYLYPAEKYCFLLEENREAFWSVHNSSNGEFNDFPKYVLQLGLDDIKQILIEPLLVA